LEKTAATFWIHECRGLYRGWTDSSGGLKPAEQEAGAGVGAGRHEPAHLGASHIGRRRTTMTALVPHPSWCSPTDCRIGSTDGSVHMSRPVHPRSSRTGLAVTVQLVQHERIDGYPFSDLPLISLVIRFPDDGPDHPAEEYAFSLDDELAQTVGRILVSVGRQAALSTPRPT
jgi:hypothetical protein